MATPPEISVIVATRNRALQLRRLLQGLAEQGAAPAFEVLVADNGSTDGTADVIRELQSALVVRSVYVGRPGKSRALNAALEQARGELIVFTDDDVMPRPDWLAGLHAASIANADCKVFGGRIEVAMETVPQWVQKSFNLMGLLTSAHDKGASPVRYGHGDYPFGPNMAIRKSLIAKVAAPFPEHLGPGTDQPVGDETCFFLRLSPPEARDRLYVPAARVVHEVAPANVRFLSAARRCYSSGMAVALLGLAPTTSATPGTAGSTVSVILQRLRSSRSLREVVCVASRYIGYLRGRRLRQKDR